MALLLISALNNLHVRKVLAKAQRREETRNQVFFARLAALRGNKYVYYIALSLLIILTASCAKKKIEVEPVDNSDTEILTVLTGRNLDSLKNKSYRDKILAFSIELGQRSKDFNQRLGQIIFLKNSVGSWQKAFDQTLKDSLFSAAEKINLGYLDSLQALITQPSEEFQTSHIDLSVAYDRLKINYRIIHDYRNFKNMSTILDSVLSNELTINKSLKDFKNTVEKTR